MGKMKAAKDGNGVNLGFEATLWLAADKMPTDIDASEYKHVVLGLIFLKSISDAFEEMHARLQSEAGEGADPADSDEYRAQNVFRVPQEARWAFLQASAKQPKIGKLVADAMVAIEWDNPSLKGEETSVRCLTRKCYRQHGACALERQLEFPVSVPVGDLPDQVLSGVRTADHDPCQEIHG